MTEPLGSWNKTKEKVHSPKGIEQIRRTVNLGLKQFFYTIDETMFRYDGMEDDERFADMLQMSLDTAPENILLTSGQVVIFDVSGSAEEPNSGGPIHMMPLAAMAGVNMYGYPAVWHAVPIGWDYNNPMGNPTQWQNIFNRKLTSKDSVILRTDRYAGTEKAYIDKMVDMMTDTVLTFNQLQMLARSPFHFNVKESQVVTANAYFNALATGQPVIFTNAEGDDITPTVDQTATPIDAALFDLFDFFQTAILEYLGFPCQAMTKRAQQSVSEVQSNSAMVELRRQDKLHQRQAAVDRMNKMFGTHVTVVSVIDEALDKLSADAKAEQEDMKDVETDMGDTESAA